MLNNTFSPIPSVKKVHTKCSISAKIYLFLCRNYMILNMKKELILITITGVDRPGLTASITETLSKYDVTIMDIGQADIHNQLSLGILFMSDEKDSGNIMKELLFKSTDLGVSIRFSLPLFLNYPFRSWRYVAIQYTTSQSFVPAPL